MSTLDGDALDRHITGNYGEDQFKGELVDSLRQQLYDEVVSSAERLDEDEKRLDVKPNYWRYRVRQRDDLPDGYYEEGIE